MIPKMSHMDVGKAGCRLPEPVSISGECPGDTVAVFAERMAVLGRRVVVDEAAFVSFVPDAALPEEAYRIDIAEEKVVVRAAGEKGAGWALTSLFWLIFQDELRVGTIYDEPRYSHRGVMLDTSRHFFDADEVKKIIEQCALLKINRFHWHISDDRGYRLESAAFPKLNSVGSCRTERDGSISKGYYTKGEVADVVEFARKRGVEIIPEIDVPGHSLALIASYPELGCRQEEVQVAVDGGIEKRILCAGREGTHLFLCALLDEICEMFPGKWFHLGGDEAPKDEWEQCPHCRKKLEEEHLTDFEDLQAWFMREVGAYLTEKGKTVICWNEAAASGKLPKEYVVQYWDELHPDKKNLEEASSGRRVICSNIHKFYMDYGYGLVPLQATYEYEPSMMGKAIVEDGVLGVEAPLWTEWIDEARALEKMLFPRLCALAENGWTREKEYSDFCKRIPGYREMAKLYKVAVKDERVCENADARLLEEVVRDAARMCMLEADAEKSVEENLALARRRMEGWLTHLQGAYYTTQEREEIFELCREYIKGV